jgi:hypothetical protein
MITASNIAAIIVPLMSSNPAVQHGVVHGFPAAWCGHSSTLMVAGRGGHGLPADDTIGMLPTADNTS